MPSSATSKIVKRSAWLITVNVSFLVLFPDPVLHAQVIGTNSSFSDNFESVDTKSAIVEAVSQTEDLLKENLILQEQVRSISAALVEARQQTEIASAENVELKTRVEALGLNAVGNSRSKLEQRLVKAVSDLNESQASAGKYKQSLAALSEAVLSLLKTSKDVSPEGRLAVEGELRNADMQLNGPQSVADKAQPTTTSIASSRVISIKPEMSLLVGNIGSLEGVKVGMPFQVFEGQQIVATARVVDVREKIFGALIQENLSEKTSVKVGQRLKVAAEKSL